MGDSRLANDNCVVDFGHDGVCLQGCSSDWSSLFRLKSRKSAATQVCS